jgi:hypothetical protein
VHDVTLSIDFDLLTGYSVDTMANHYMQRWDKGYD